jgi:hypothetical protein
MCAPLSAARVHFSVRTGARWRVLTSMKMTRVVLPVLVLAAGSAALPACGDLAPPPDQVTVSQALTGTKLATTLLSAPGWTNPANLLDGNTTTKSTNTAATASIELALSGSHQITTVRVAEDNVAPGKVDAFGIQCWNGTSYDAELFRETNTPVAVPGFNEHVISGTTCSTSRVKVNLYNNASLEAFEIQLYGTAPSTRPVYVDISNGPGGSMFPTGLVTFPAGSDVNFHFDPDPGYRLAQICTPDYDICQTVHDTEFTIKSIGGNDRIFWATFEPIPTGSVQLAVQVLASTFVTPSAVVDADVTNSKSIGKTNNLASIDLAFDGYYELDYVQVFEDNGNQEIDQYGVQCWNGTGWNAELFRANSANLVKPVPNTYVTGGASCTTNRMRVNFYNNGIVEVFGVKLFGTYHNTLHTDAGTVPLGVHRDASGLSVDTQEQLHYGAPYCEKLNATNPATEWIYDEAAPSDWFGTVARNTVDFTGMYIRNCQTGVWTNVYATSYTPPEFPLEIDTASRTFRFFLSDRPDVRNGFPDPSFDCWDDPSDFLTVLYNNVPTKIMHNGTSRFMYVLTQR